VANVRDVERGRDDRGGEVTGVMDEHRWPPRARDVKEFGKLRRCGDFAEEAREDVARQFGPGHRADLRVSLEAERVRMLRREADPPDGEADLGQPLGCR
jgi:hypothetical protein